MEFKDYYKILGVSDEAGADALKHAFRDLARKYHPDRAKPEERSESESKFKEVNEAYEVLSDPEKRRKYDALRNGWRKPAGTASSGDGGGSRGAPRFTRRGGREGAHQYHFGGTGFSDFFEEFFGGRGDVSSPFSRGAQQSGFTERGHDVESEILVTLEEVARGSVRKVSLTKVDPETGRESADSFTLRIPPGVREGQRLKVSGHGQAGLAGGPSGDLFLRVRYARHPDFRVRGSDLYYELNIAPWEAVLGARVRVPTLHGSVQMRVPAGTQSGQKLRVRGKGLPARGGGHGDLFAEVVICVPTHTTPRERERWEELARTSEYNPRDSSDS